MIELIIDGKTLHVKEGTTVMEAALRLGIKIPSMCHNGDLPHFSSCMICLVKNQTNNKLFTSCTVAVAPGMNIITMDEEIREARKTALDLLLSDHTGDCEAPCQISCPAHMDIPAMNGFIAGGEFEKAYHIVLQDIALPSILGRICPAPCESACRRKSADQAVSICLLKRWVGDVPAFAGTTEKGAVGGVPTFAGMTKEVAVVGSGPHGLSAAWYLQQMGYQCTIFDKNLLPGGALRDQVPVEKLPVEVLDREIERISRAGVKFQMNSEIDQERIKELEKQFDAVVYPLEKAPKMAVRASALGKEAAWKVHQTLSGEPVAGLQKNFNSRFSKLLEPEIAEYLKEAATGNRIEPSGGLKDEFSREEAMSEAARCMHCECRKPDSCLLRIYAHEYGADQKRFSGTPRKTLTRVIQHDTVVYEPRKCIKCGICIRITTKRKEELGLTFIGRGFDVEIGVPFNGTIREGLTHTAEEVVIACPTGALAMKGGGK